MKAAADVEAATSANLKAARAARRQALSTAAAVAAEAWPPNAAAAEQTAAEPHATEATLAVDAVLRLKGSGNLDAIQIIKIQGGTLEDSFLDEGMSLS